MAGCVFFSTGDVIFEKDTVIQPENYFAIPYNKITSDAYVLGQMPSEFHSRLLSAINESIVLTPREQAVFLRELDP